MGAANSNPPTGEDPPFSKELDFVSELFHRINRVLPQNQKPLTIPSNTKVRDAIELMQKTGFSQIPVSEGGEVVGVFSFRSFAYEAGKGGLDYWEKQRCAPGDLEVGEYVEKFRFVQVTDELKSVFDSMNRDNGVLVGTAEQLQGVLTPMDFLEYLYQVASPFVLLSEIELALRALVRTCMSEQEIAEAAKLTLKSLYKDREERIPTQLADMTFDNYQLLICHGETWSKFEKLFGGMRDRLRAKLKEIGTLRNDLFHFKRAIQLYEHEQLLKHRNWFLLKLKSVESDRKRAH